MSSYYIPLVILILFLVSVTTRVLPFIFTKQLINNKKAQVIGKRLSTYIMMSLVIYEINPNTFKVYPYAIPEILSIILVVLLHLSLRKPLLSMIMGTISYIILKKLFFY